MECSSSGDNSTSPVSSHQHPPSKQSLLPVSSFSAAAVSEIISLPRFIITLAEKAAVSNLPKHPPTIVIQPASCLSSSPHRLCGVDCPEDKKERRRPFHKSHKKEWTSTQCPKWMWWSWKKFSGTFESKHVPRTSLWLYVPKLKLTTGTGWWVDSGWIESGWQSEDCVWKFTVISECFYDSFVVVSSQLFLSWSSHLATQSAPIVSTTTKFITINSHNFQLNLFSQPNYAEK